MSINIKSPHEYLNATVVGTPTISEGVVSGFSASNYLKLPEIFNPSSAPWEVVFKVNVADYSNGGIIFGQRNGTYFYIRTEATGVFVTGYSNTILNGTTQIILGKDYWVKARHDGTKLYLELSEDGINYTEENSVTIPPAFSTSSDPQYVGLWYNTYANGLYNTFNGSIDLKESYIKINGEYWWRGVEVDQYKEIKRLYYSGSNLIKQVYKTDKTKYYKYVWEDWTQPVLTANGTMGGDSFATYTPNTIDKNGPIYNAFNTTATAPHFYDEVPTSIVFYNPKKIKIQKISFIQHGTAYWVKGVFQGSNDNATWTDIKTINVSSTPVIFDVNSTEGYKYHRFYITSAYSNDVTIGQFAITAQEEKIVEVTADDDHDYSELIPQLVYEHNPTVFEQSTAGTYTFNVTEEAPYEITLVGGGGGGAFNSSGNAGSAAAGNSGSGLVVNAVLKAGTYVLNVGAGGAWSGGLDANTWGGNGSQSSISKDGEVIATAGGGTGNHCWWRSGSERNSTVGAAPTYTDALGVTDVILNTQGNWGGLAATSSGGASVISGTTWGKGGDTRNRNAADNGNAGCIKIRRMSYVYLTVNAEPDEATIKVNGDML